MTHKSDCGDIFTTKMSYSQIASSKPEDIFVELFSQVFGLEKVQLLVPEMPFYDIYGSTRYIDFALKTISQKIAFEIDGLVWHHPDAISIGKFEDDLLRQNSLIYRGWKVFRWTDREIADQPEKVKSELETFVKSYDNFIDFDDFLPKQSGGSIELKDHQQESLDELTRLRAEGKTIALITHATGTGKTIVAISDARRIARKVLYVAHTKELVKQTYNKFKEMWSEANIGLFAGTEQNYIQDVVVTTRQSIVRRLQSFTQNYFDYLIIDEAHHATSKSYKQILAYFQPKFILGLTATPQRADGQDLLEIFKDCAHHLSLKDAIEKGELVPIRCVRVKTNVDLRKVRFNEVKYNQKDIEESIIIPARDNLIIDTYLNHVPNSKAVVFCVNIRHGETLAELFRSRGVAASSVSGRMKAKDRDAIQIDYKNNNLQVLCACDVLNEGWDCPDIQVLFMARPTLSRVIYLQQLGRGTRKAPGKECLIVFDFVDNFTPYNVPLSLHRITGERRYQAGSLVLAPEDIKKNDNPTNAPEILNINLWTKDFEEIDIFNWQEVITDMISVSDLEIELSTSENLIKRAVENGTILPDHTIQLGERIYNYFKKDRVEEVRRHLNIPIIDNQTIKQIFIKFVNEMDMSSSYKPVFLLSLIHSVNEKGYARKANVAEQFKLFYINRLNSNLIVEKNTVKMSRIQDLSDYEIQQTMLELPFEKFERRKFLEYSKSELSYIRFNRYLWNQIKSRDINFIKECCQEAIKQYYGRLIK